MSQRAFAAVAILAIAGASAALNAQVEGEAPKAEGRTFSPIAIVGFSTAKDIDERDVWMATAVEEQLCWRLRHLPELTVMPTVRAYQARRELQENDEIPTWEATLPLLGARWHVLGTLSGTPTECVLELRCVTLGGEPPTQESERIGPDRLFAVLDRATEWLLARFGVDRLETATRDLVFARPAETTSGLEYYAKAVDAARRDNPRDTIYYLEKAIVADPTQPYVHQMLAQVEARLSAEARATAAARLRHIQERAREVGDVALDIDVEVNQAALLSAARSFDPAVQRLERALALAREQRDVYRQLSVLNALADVYVRREAYPDAELTKEDKNHFQDEQLRRAAAPLAQVLELLVRLGDVVAEAPIANKLALIHDRLGDESRAYELHQRTLAAARKTGGRRSVATAWMFLGQWYRQQERYDEAREAMEHCLEFADERSKPKVRIALADVYRACEDPERALREYKSAYDALERSGGMEDTRALEDQLLCLDRIAELHKQLGRRAEAIRALQEALDVAEVLGLSIELTLREKLAKWKAESSP